MLWGWKAQIFQIRREEVLKNERVCYVSNTHLFNLRELRLEGCLASKYWPSLSHNLPTKNLWIGSFDNVTLPRCQHLEYSILPQEVPYERGKFISLILSQTFGRLFAALQMWTSIQQSQNRHFSKQAFLKTIFACYMQWMWCLATWAVENLFVERVLMLTCPKDIFIT